MKPIQNVILWTLLITATMYTVAIITGRIINHFEINTLNLPGLTGLFAAVTALVVAVAIERHENKCTIRTAFAGLGFKRGNRSQIKSTSIGIFLVMLGFATISAFYNKSFALVPGALFLFFKLFIAQGLIEEAVFRGLIFRHLRKYYSFTFSATASGFLFAAIHLLNLMKGTSPEILTAVATSVVFGFLLTFPLASLFEIGNYSILAGCLYHLAVDSINCFNELGDSGSSMNTYLAFIFLSGMTVFLMSKKYILKSRIEQVDHIERA